MLYEVREYVAVPGRLPAVIELFNEATIPLFAKHGMELVHVGRTSIGSDSLNELVYTLRFNDIAELEQKWTAFLHDPEWITAAAAKEVAGPMLQSIRRRLLDPGPFDAAAEQ